LYGSKLAFKHGVLGRLRGSSVAVLLFFAGVARQGVALGYGLCERFKTTPTEAV